jgi:hypothetical protein
LYHKAGNSTSNNYGRVLEEYLNDEWRAEEQTVYEKKDNEKHLSLLKQMVCNLS